MPNNGSTFFGNNEVGEYATLAKEVSHVPHCMMNINHMHFDKKYLSDLFMIYMQVKSWSKTHFSKWKILLFSTNLNKPLCSNNNTNDKIEKMLHAQRTSLAGSSWSVLLVIATV